MSGVSVSCTGGWRIFAIGLASISVSSTSHVKNKDSARNRSWAVASACVANSCSMKLRQCSWVIRLAAFGIPTAVR